jgi:hypothetical protein
MVFENKKIKNIKNKKKDFKHFLHAHHSYVYEVVWSEIVSVVGRKISIPSSIIDKI